MNDYKTDNITKVSDMAVSSSSSIRYDYVDLAKCVMILLVVAGHIIEGNFVRAEKEPLHAFIYSFHMPLFFLLSGYVMGITQKKLQMQPFLKWFWRKVNTLLVPYIVWRLIVYRYADSVGEDIPFVIALQELVTNPSQGGAWFLISLFCIQVVCYPIFRYDKIYFWAVPILYLILGILMGGHFNYCNPNHYLGFLFGFLLYKYNNFLLCHETATIGVLLFASSAIIYPHPLLLTSSAGIALLYVCKILCDSVICGGFVYRKMLDIGKNTLAVYLIHVLFLFTILGRRIDVSQIRVAPVLLITIVIAFIISLICLYIAKVIALFPLLNRLLLGKVSINRNIAYQCYI